MFNLLKGVIKMKTNNDWAGADPNVDPEPEEQLDDNWDETDEEWESEVNDNEKDERD